MTPVILALILAATPPPPVPLSFQDEVLSAHNTERASLRLPPLAWSDSLAADAQVWADHLAATGVFQHDANNANEGENLWMGTAGRFSHANMVGGWTEEKRFFRYGVFPDVSNDGDWTHVGHYTQLIWRDTTQVGCALSTGQGWDYLVCRYSPQGNYEGERPY